jgi:hypothetical protein
MSLPPRKDDQKDDPKKDDDMDGGATQPIAVVDDQDAAMERMRNRLRAELMASDAITAQARRTELQDEITVVRIRAEEQAKRTAFVEANIERMRAQPAAVPLVTNYYNNIQPITTNVANVFQNFQNFSTQFNQNVYHAHQNTINHVTNNATRAINMAVKLAMPLSDAFLEPPQDSKKRRAEILNVLANGRGDDDDDIPPAAGAVRRAIQNVENTQSSSSSGINSAPQPLVAPNAKAQALPLQPLNESERSTPYHVPVKPASKPRLLDMTKIKATPPPAPPANYLPPSYLVPPPRIQLEDAPIRIKRGTRMEDVVVDVDKKSKKRKYMGGGGEFDLSDNAVRPAPPRKRSTVVKPYTPMENLDLGLAMALAMPKSKRRPGVRVVPP